MKRALLALILALPLALSAQFRIVGTGLFTTLNDSTYRAKIDFRPDLTGNSYNPTQLNDSMLVLSQKGQLYRLDSFYNASFSSAFIIVVEKNGNWGSPVGQIMVFQNNSSLAAPQAVYGANGATAGMQAGVDTWNSLLLKVVSDSAVYWNQAYSNSIDSLNVSGDSLKTITLYRASGDSISATFVDGGGGGPVTDTLTGEVKGPLDSTYIDTVANIIFTTTTDTTVGVGELEYNDTQGSLIQGLKGGNVTNVIGQQIHQRVTNATGAPLTKGTAVFLHGSQGNRITVRKALATADSTSANTFGIVAESIADNQSGYVITEGLITNMNTNALTEGAAVYLSPTVAGELTTTKPQAPQHTVYIGVCVKQNTGSGELFVKIRNGQELDELHDVRIDSLASNASLYYNAAQGVWRDTTGAVLASDTSVFARDFQINGTANYLAKFTGSNSVGNSVAFETGRNLYINSAQGNTSNALNNSFEFNGYGSAALDQPFLAVIGNVGVADYRPRLAMYRTKGTTVNDRTLVPFNHHLGSIQWNAADGVDMLSTGAEITAITDSITGENDMPTALTFATTANGAASTTERMRITSAGNVGIANNAPTNLLDVGNTSTGPTATIGIKTNTSAATTKVSFENGTSVKGDVLTTSNATVIGTGGMAIQTTTNHPIIFRTNSSGVESGGNERMRILEGGNVGINTTTPAYRLDVNGDVNTTGMYKKSGTDIISGTTNYIPKFTGANTIGNSGFIENGQEVYLGGTANAFNFSRFSIYYNPRNNDFPIVSDTRNYATYTGAGDSITPFGGWSFGGKYNSSDELTAFASIQGKKEDLTQSRKGSMIFSTNDDTPGGLFPKERMRITSAGNVGIATASPSRPLHVNANSSMIIPSGATGTRPAPGAEGDIRFNSTVGIKNLEWYNGTAWREPVNAARSPAVGLANRFSKFDANGLLDTSAVLVQNGSNIGIGTASATNLLTIKSQSTSDIPVSVRSSAASNINIVALSESNGAGAVSLKDKNGNTDIVLNTDITAFNISNDTTPPYIIAASYSPTSGNGPEINLSRARGTEASPSAVSNDDELGEINFSGRSTSSGQITAAIRALADSVVTSRLNTGLAFYTGATTATLTERMRINSKGKVGIGNSPAAGDSALTVTGGIRATTGVRATRLSVNTFSTQVLSINNYAGSGSGLNVWIGTGGQSTTSGAQNASIGFQAMQSNTTGNYNMAIGSDALKANTSGSANVAIGAAAMIFNTEGKYNTALGQGALTNSTNSNHNIAIGQEALSAYTEIGEGGNVAIGNASISAKTNGVNDIAIGRYSGYFTDSIWNFTNVNTNSSSSVYIGNFTRTGGNNRENQIIIGHQAIGNGSNTTTIGNSSTTNTVIPAGSLTVDVMRRKAPVTVTSNHTVAASTSWLICNGTAAITLTLPAASSWTGREIMVKTIQPQAVNSASSNVVPIDGTATGTAILPATDGAWCTLVSDGTNWIIMQKG